MCTEPQHPPQNPSPTRHKQTENKKTKKGCLTTSTAFPQRPPDHCRRHCHQRHGGQDTAETTGIPAAQGVADPLSDVDESVQIDAGAEAAALQEIHQVLGGHAASGTDSSGAAAQAHDAGVEGADAKVQSHTH